MEWLKTKLKIRTNGKGMTNITSPIEGCIRTWDIEEGMCFLFMPHTSASLTTCEAYDPTAQFDVEQFYERVSPENQGWYAHTLEGPDDSPSHIRSTLTQPSLSIPIENGSLFLGTWQGVFLFEHRSRPHQRNLHIRCLKVS